MSKADARMSDVLAAASNSRVYIAKLFNLHSDRSVCRVFCVRKPARRRRLYIPQIPCASCRHIAANQAKQHSQQVMQRAEALPEIALFPPAYERLHAYVGGMA